MNPEDASNAVQLINGVLQLLSSAKSMFERAQKSLRKAHLQRYGTPRALQRALVRGEIEVGETVKVEGYLSRFAHLHKPISFVNVRQDSERMASMVAQTKARMVSMSAVRVAQNPITALPPFSVEEEPVRCLFLYPGSHDRFIYAKTVNKKDDLNSLRLPDYLSPRIAIPPDAWPVPVLVSDEEGLVLAERRVKLVAVVRALPPDLAERFQHLYAGHYDRAVLSNFLLLHKEPSLSFCLSALPSDQDTGAEAQKAIFGYDRSLLYVEGHVEGSYKNNLADAISRSIPLDERVGELSRTSFGAGSVEIGGSATGNAGALFQMVAAPQDMSVTVKPPNVIGFYAETGPTRGLVKRTGELAELVSSFRRNLAAEPNDDGEPLALSMDFLFDFERQGLFADDGVLSSETALQALRGDDSLDDAVRWLRGSGTN